MELTRGRGEAKVDAGMDIVGGAWVHEVAAGNNKGKQFLSISLDRGLKLALNDSDPVFLFPRQTFRDGKKDSDYLVCVQKSA